MRQSTKSGASTGVSLLALTMAAAISSPVIAQEGNSEEATARDAGAYVDVITVTARKKSEDLQDVPISVTAYDSRAIEAYGFRDSLSIADQVPNLAIKTFAGQPNIFIRGVGNNDFNATTISPVSVYSDDVLKGAPASQLVQMFDMERMEVLRGPQGTLFGRNTTGGALQFFSRTPGDEVDGFVRMGVGSFNRTDVEAAGTFVAIPGTLATRIAAMSLRSDGDRTNLYTGDPANGIDMSAVRAITRFTPNDDWEFLWKIHAGQDRSDGFQGKAEGAFPGGVDLLGYADPNLDDVTVININAPSVHNVDVWGTSLITTWQGDTFTIKSVSAFDDFNSESCLDVDHSPNSLDAVCVNSDGHQLSQEFTISSDAGERFDWVAGAYFLHETLRYDSFGDLFGDVPAFVTPINGHAERETDAASLYGEVTVNLSDRLRATGGLRYTHEEKDATLATRLVFGLFDPGTPNGPIVPLIPETPLADSWDALSGRFILQYDLSDDDMVYASFSRGFKSGGFNLGAFFSLDELTTVEPEYLNSYEIGIKTLSFDRRLKANLSAFLYDYTDLQVYTYTPAIILALENAADATIYGAEAELQAVPVAGLDITLGVGYLHTEYDNFFSNLLGDLSGNPLPGAPEWNVNFAAQYEMNLTDNFSLTPRVEFVHVGNMYFNASHDDDVSSRGSHQLFNGRLTLAPGDGNWEVALWGKNLADEEYIVDSGDLSGTFGFATRYFGARRAFGGEVSVRF